MIIITRDIKTLQEQNKMFEILEPCSFKRVHLMAQDIKAKIDDERKKDELKRKKGKTLYGGQ